MFESTQDPGGTPATVATSVEQIKNQITNLPTANITIDPTDPRADFVSFNAYSTSGTAADGDVVLVKAATYSDIFSIPKVNDLTVYAWGAKWDQSGYLGATISIIEMLGNSVADPIKNMNWYGAGALQISPLSLRIPTYIQYV